MSFYGHLPMSLRGKGEEKPSMCGTIKSAPVLRSTNPLPTDFKQWRGGTTQRIYNMLRFEHGVKVKGDKIPPNVRGNFVIDGFKVRVTKADGGKHRVFLVVGKGKNPRLVPVGRVHQANLTTEDFYAARNL